ncbi:MAG: nuclear transport factor 2 family protein [Bacteroidota bacterium]
MLMAFTLSSCETTSSTFDYEQAKAEIYALHQAQRDFHFEKDSVAFANLLSPDFISVNRGSINHPTYQETLARNHRYFSSVRFLKWDDMAEPIIRFSNDGSLAYTIVDKQVEVASYDDLGEEVISQTHFAWMAIYRKTDQGWKIESVVSTNE